MSRRPGGFARRYGAPPWHLVALLLCFALTAYTVLRLEDDPALLQIALWFLGVAVAWDLLLGPLLALADRAAVRLPAPRGVPLVNHVRAPALVSGALLLVWAPVILQRSEGVFRTKAGLGQDVFLGRWLTVTAVLFVASAAVWLVRVLRSGRTA